ncbi:MAG TPA: mechanosensitive ion channel protein MscS [Bacteroidales bacterium]|nr:mechanosensitive ion channel protein MscS [Bacteroidales bacterium]
MVKRTTSTFDDILLEKGVFKRLAHLVPAVVVFYMIPNVFGGIYAEVQDELVSKIVNGWIQFFKDMVSVYMIVIGVMTLVSALNAVNIVFNQMDIADRIPIKGYVQVVQFILILIAVVWVLSILFNFHLKGFFTGLGAFVAVLVLVFKDSLLGLVASIQLSVNRLVRIGDWVTIPSRGADGTVLEITVNTVKIENFDKTITTLPTYSLISEHVQNWRGMEESNGRRIKRFVNIDISSVHFCTEEQLDHLEKIKLLKDYIQTSRSQITLDQAKFGADPTLPGFGSNLTNLGIFRKYLELYLRSHPKIQQDMTFMVRQLQPTERGVPLEVYVFCTDKAWESYESIQSDLFDHILAIMPEFDLRVFQGPTGQDLKQLTIK